MEARTLALRSLVLTSALAAITLGTISCRCGRMIPTHDLALERQTFGALVQDAIVPNVDLAPLLLKARALLDGKPAPPCPNEQGRLVFLTAYPARGDRVTSRGLGDTLEASLTTAAQELARQHPAPPFRLEIDVVDRITPTLLEDGDVSASDVGIEGYAIVRPGSLGYALPSDVMLEHDFEVGAKSHLDATKIRALIDARAGSSEANGKTYALHTQAAIESASLARALPMIRGAIAAPTSVEAADLYEAVRMGADYLARVIKDDGRFIYQYQARTDKPLLTYGMIRHAGATYALLEAYEQFKTPLYLSKAELALAYLRKRITTETNASGEKTATLTDAKDEELQKVGGAGLSLVALTKHAQITGDRDDLERMRALALLIVRQQYEDGHFRNNADVVREGKANGKDLKPEVIYYIGEAILGLTRLYAIDPDPRWLATAKKGADYCVDVRDATTTDETQEHDHWLSYALGDLYRVTHDPRYAKHAYRIARAIIFKEKTAKNAPPDMVGSFYAEGQSTPASTRMEAFASDIELARIAGDDDAWLLPPALSIARFVKGHQWDDDDAYMLANPAKARGGVREGLFVDDVRIDYVQHAMSGWLHLARAIDPSLAGGAGHRP